MNVLARESMLRHSSEWRRRHFVLALLVVLASLLMHLLALAWLNGALGGVGFGAKEPEPLAVQVALIAPPAAPAPAPVPAPALAKPKPKPAPRTKTSPAAPRPVASPPRPDAITAPTRQQAEALQELKQMVPVSPEAFFGAPEPEAPAAPGSQAADDGQASAVDPAQLASLATPGEAGSGRPDERPVALPAPPTGKWRFNVHFGEYGEGYQVATLDYEIAIEGRRYRLRTEGRASGLTSLFYSGVLTQTSAGILSDAGLLPERYSERRGSKPERTLRVDRESRQVHFAGREPVALVDGAQDRLSVLVQLGMMARAQPDRFVQGAVVSLPELTLGDIEKSSYTSIGDAVLPTRNGPIRALHLERTEPRGKDAKRIEIWLGYDLQLIPVRIRVTDVGGRVLDQILAR